MIRLGRFPSPEIETDPYVINSKQRLINYLRRSKEEREQRRASIDEEFYFWEPMRQAVEKRCLRKCVFCERLATKVDTLIETFRPLRNAKDKGNYSTQNHYIWLAYEFENLVQVCIECSRRKHNAFPVVGQRAPYLTPMSEIDHYETRLIVNPYLDNPQQHLVFFADGRCEGSTPRGQSTIELFQLNDRRLLAERANEMDKFLFQLKDSIQAGGHGASLLLESDFHYAGARIGLARRLFDALGLGGGIRMQGASTAFAHRFQRALTDLEVVQEDRILRRLDEFVQDDKARRVVDTDKLWSSEPVLSAPLFSDSNHVETSQAGGLRRIHIRNFKGIHDLDIVLHHSRKKSKTVPCLMLLGENSVGKTSILQAIALALGGARNARKLVREHSAFFRAEHKDRWDQLTPHDAIVEAELRFGGEASFHLSATEKLINGQSSPASLVLGYGPRRYFDPRNSKRLHSDHARLRTLFDPTAALPYAGEWLDRIGGHQFNEVAKMMRVVLSLSDEDELVKDIDGRICVSLGGDRIPLDRLSEGYRSVFALVADIARELLRVFRSLEDAEAIVLIDEIDTHLHPRWKMRVMSSLRRALPGVQFIVTTHDPLCLRGMDDGEVVVLQRNENGQIVQLEDLPSIKGMRADQLLTSDYFGLSSTVDPDTELGVARYAAEVAEIPPAMVKEADRLVQQLALGDNVLEQIVQSALLSFLEQRQRPRGQLRSNVRTEAVQTIIDALKRDRQVPNRRTTDS